MRSRGGPRLSATPRNGIPIQSLLRRAAHVFRTSTILAAGATTAVSAAGTLAILGIANEGLDQAQAPRFRPPAAIAQAELPPVALQFPILGELSRVPIVERELAQPEVAPTQTEAPPPNPEPQPQPNPPPGANPPPEPSPPACEAPIVGEIPSIPVIGCPLEALPL